MRFYTTESGDSNWAPIAVIMTVLVVVMAMGYFFWYVPSQVPAGGVTREVIVNNPDCQAVIFNAAKPSIKNSIPDIYKIPL